MDPFWSEEGFLIEWNLRSPKYTRLLNKVGYLIFSFQHESQKLL